MVIYLNILYIFFNFFTLFKYRGADRKTFFSRGGFKSLTAAGIFKCSVLIIDSPAYIFSTFVAA